MRIKELIREITVSAWVLRVPSGTIAGIAAIMCLASLLTVGRAAAADDQLNARLDEAGSRTFSIVDDKKTGLFTPQIINTIAQINHIEHIYGFSVASDVHNTYLGPGGNAVPARYYHGEINEVVKLIEGRWPNPGEAIVEESAQLSLAMQSPYGSVTFTREGLEHAVVGKYEVLVDIDGIESVLIASTENQELPVLQAVVDDVANVDASVYFAASIIGTHDPEQIRIQKPTSISALAGVVTGDLSQYSAAILYGVLGIGGAICSLIVFADALSRRSDLGRRLALGAKRSTITIYMVGRTLLPAIVGVLIGSGAGMLATMRLGYPAPLDFTGGTAILTLIIMALSAIPGAIWASHQDPVKVLRTP